MKILAIAKRILQQLYRDKRTLALLLMVPILLLTLIYFLLDSTSTQQAIALANGPLQYEQQLEERNVQVIRCTEEASWQLLEQGVVSAIVQVVDGRLNIQLDGSHTNAQQLLIQLESAQQNSSGWQPSDFYPQIDYVYGYEGLSMFDRFGSALIGILVFFLIF